jgi:hypothetical protein
MKNIYFILTFMWMLTTEISAQNLLTEDFIYAPIDSLENSGNWYRSGIDSKYNIKVVGPGLEYKDYVGSARGNSCLLTNSGNGDVLYHNFSEAITAGSAYLSFMFCMDNLPSSVTKGYCIGYNPNTGGTNINTSLHINRISDSTFSLGVQKTINEDIDYVSTLFKIQKTYLIVLKYSIIPGTGNDVSSLYVFDKGVPATEPNLPMASTVDGGDYTGQGSVVLVNNYAQSGLNGCYILLDGIRVGNSWASSVLNPISSTQSEAEPSKLTSTHYPNPFHRMTTISYQIPTKGIVQINIFNETGKLCAALLNEEKESGTHEIEWNADSFVAGIYLCKIKFNSIETVQKLFLVK